MWKVTQIEGYFCCFTEERKFHTSNYKVSAAKLFVQQDNSLGIPRRKKEKKEFGLSNQNMKLPVGEENFSLPDIKHITKHSHLSN